MVKWVDPFLQKKVQFRPGDTIISVPPKSGTTWMMNIVYQLITGGNEDFKDIYAEIPWIEFRERPDQSDEELLERWAALPDPRGFKTHAYPGEGPEAFIKYREDVKYIAVFRNPEEAVVSFKPFLEGHSMEIWDMWGLKSLREEFIQPNFPAFFEKCILGMPGMPREAVPPGGMLTMDYFSFINAWWPLRNKPNVLMLHFSDMKADHKAMVEKISNFLGTELTEEQMLNVLEYTSFKWMKQNQSKFEATTLLPFLILNTGGMIRKGEAGKAAEDGMTPKISAQIRSLAEQVVYDNQALEWMYNGGPLPRLERSRKCNIL